MSENEAPKKPTYQELRAKLNPRHQKFVDAYFECGLNASEAALEAGYKDKTETSRLMPRPDIQAAIQARLDQDVMSGAEVLTRLSIMARGTMSDFLRVHPEERFFWEQAHPGLDETLEDLVWDLSTKYGPQNVARNEMGEVFYRKSEVGHKVEFDWERAKELRRLGLIKKLKKERDGSVSFELHDPTKSLELLARHHKLLTDKVEMAGDGGGSLEVTVRREIVTKVQKED